MYNVAVTNSCQAEKTSEAKAEKVVEVEKTIEMEKTEKTIVESTKVGNSVDLDGMGKWYLHGKLF